MTKDKVHEFIDKLIRSSLKPDSEIKEVDVYYASKYPVKKCIIEIKFNVNEEAITNLNNYRELESSKCCYNCNYSEYDESSEPNELFCLFDKANKKFKHFKDGINILAIGLCDDFLNKHKYKPEAK